MSITVSVTVPTASEVVHAADEVAHKAGKNIKKTTDNIKRNSIILSEKIKAAKKAFDRSVRQDTIKSKMKSSKSK